MAAMVTCEFEATSELTKSMSDTRKGKARLGFKCRPCKHKFSILTIY